jgi:4-amino-4-deoxy-L-arabinose transferase-like glycosyltransferase
MDLRTLGLQHDRRRLPDDCRLTGRAAAVIVLFGLSMLLPGLGSAHVLTYHEVVFAGPAKEMIATGNWILPKIGGVPFTDKPPATAWSIAASMLLFGSHGEWVVRLPSVVAAIAAALLVGAMAARWFGRTVGFVAGMIQLTCLYVLTQARLSEADMLLTAATTATMSIWALAHVESPRGRVTDRRLAWLFYAALAGVFFIKGLVGPVMIIAGCVSFAFLQRDFAQLRFLLNPVGIAIFIAPIVAWFTAAYQQFPGILDNMVRHHFGRFQGVLGQHEPWYGYWYLIPQAVLPWFPLVLVALVRGLRTGWAADARWRFLLCWIVPGLAMLSWSTFKARHYPMPLLPPLAILAAQGLLDYMSSRAQARRLGSLALSALTVVCCSVGIVLVERHVRRAPHETAAMIGLLGVGLLAVIECERRRRIAAGLTMMFATVWCVSVGVQLFVFGRHDSYRPQTELAQRINEAVPPGQTIHVVGLPDNQILYYLDRPLVRIDERADFAAVEAAAPGELYVVAAQHFTDELAARAPVETLDRCAGLNSYMTEQHRLMFVRTTPQLAAAPARVTTPAGAPLRR